MAILTQRSYFGEAPGRLQRALDLDGLVQCDVEGTIVPMVLVADGTEVGMSSKRNRAWQFVLGALPTGQNVVIASSDKFIVDGFSAGILGGTAGQDLIALYQYPPGVAAPAAPAAAIAQFTEDYRGDLSPVLVGNGAGAATVGPIGTWLLGSGSTQVDLRMSVLPGCTIAWRWVASVAGTLNLTVRGRMF